RVGESTFRKDPPAAGLRHPVGPGTSSEAGTSWKGVQRSTGPRGALAGVAADAGVGVGTVSRVLNGSDQVRDTTLRTVLDSIDRLGYRPSPPGATLGRGNARTGATL